MAKPQPKPEPDRWHEEPEPEPTTTCPACGQPTRWSHGFELCACQSERWPWR